MRQKLNFDAVQSGDYLYMYNRYYRTESVFKYKVKDTKTIFNSYIIYTLDGFADIVINIDRQHSDHDIYRDYVVCTSYREAEGRRRKSLKRKIKGIKKQRQYYINKRRACDNIIKSNDAFIDAAEENVKQKNNYII